MLLGEENLILFVEKYTYTSQIIKYFQKYNYHYIKYYFFNCLEAKSESFRPLPATPKEEEELKIYPWFLDVSRKDAEIAVCKGICMSSKFVFRFIFSCLSALFDLYLQIVFLLRNLFIAQCSRPSCQQCGANRPPATIPHFSTS